MAQKPGMTEAEVREAWTRSRDGTRLFYRRWGVQEPRGAVLIVHGYAEHSGRYGHVAEFLNGLGLDVFALDVRGHGRSEGARGYVRRFEDYHDDVNAVLEAMERESAAAERWVLGHSNGGLIALHQAARGGLDCRGLIVTSPFLGIAVRVPAWKAALGRVMSVLYPKLSLPSGLDPKNLSRDPAVGEAYAADPLVFDTATARFFTESARAMAETFERAARIRLPCLVLHATEDRIADRTRAQPLYEAFGSDDKHLVAFEGHYHEILNERGKEKVFAEIEKWLERGIGK